MYLIVIRYTLHLLIDYSTIVVDVEKYILSIFILFFGIMISVPLFLI